MISAWIRSACARSSRSLATRDSNQARYASRVGKIFFFLFILVSLEVAENRPDVDSEISERNHDRLDLTPVDALFFIHQARMPASAFPRKMAVRDTW